MSETADFSSGASKQADDEIVNSAFKDRLSFAQHHSTWYRTKKRRKQRLSALLRVPGIICLIGGGLAPQVSALIGTGLNELGYLLLAISAACS